MARPTSATTISKPDQAVFTTDNTPSSIYDCSLPTPHMTASPLRLHVKGGLSKCSTGNSSSAGAPKLNASISQRQVDNSWPEIINHVICQHIWETNIQSLRHTPSTLGEDGPDIYIYIYIYIYIHISLIATRVSQLKI